MARLAAGLCGTPVALVSFIDERRQWFKSAFGLQISETPRDLSICGHAIAERGLFVVPDTTEDERFQSNPFVSGSPHIRFYAGATLETEEGFRLGTVCVVDFAPRPEGLTEVQSAGLAALARTVVAQLAHKRVNAALERSLAANARQAFLFDTAIDKMTQGLCFFGGDHRLAVCNESYASMYGLTSDQTRPGTTIDEIVARRYAVGSCPDYMPDEFVRWRKDIAAASEPSDTIVSLKDGRTIRIRHEPMPDGGWVATHEDITADMEVREHLRCLADEDPLTGLPNRRKFSECFEEVLSNAARKGTSVSLLMFDLDDFKDVNDTLGHDAGDALLRETARRLQDVKRDCDSVARIGGDEFAMLVVEPFTFDNAVRFADHLADIVKQPFEYDGRLIASRVSIGVAAFPDHDSSPPNLMKDADIALYRAKAAGRNRVVPYAPHMRAETERRAAILVEAREALKLDQFAPFYQPKICLASGRITGFEALARWTHPAKGVLTPGYFGTAFDDTELAELIGEVMLAKVAAQISRWRDGGVACGRVAVNFAAPQFARSRLPEIVLEMLERHEVPVECFEVEVTEGVFLGATAENVLGALRTFSNAGVAVALDDFGTGYASLTHLKQYPVDHLKIDRSFVQGLGEDAGDEAIVSSVIGLAKNLKLTVTAEGVETIEQAQALRAMGCDFGQGYLFAKPMVGSRVPWLLENWGGLPVPARFDRKPSPGLKRRA